MEKRTYNYKLSYARNNGEPILSYPYIYNNLNL